MGEKMKQFFIIESNKTKKCALNAQELAGILEEADDSIDWRVTEVKEL
jgi:hypothetical protein